MIYAISPVGTVHSFPTAHWLTRNDNRSELRTSEGGDFVARIPSSWAVSFISPQMNDASNHLTIRAAMMILADEKNIKQMNNWQDNEYLMRIKDSLRRFDGRKPGWK